MQTSWQLGVPEGKEADPAVKVSAGSPEVRRVFFLLDSLQIGGTETQAVELALRLNPAHYLVTLGCLKLSGPLLAKFAGSHVSTIEFSVSGGVDSPNGVVQILRLARFLRRERFDIVHAHDLWSNLLALPAARLARVPVVISSRRDLAHLSWYTPRRRRFLRFLQKFSSAVLVNSREVERQLICEDRFSPGIIRVVYNGIDLSRFSRTRAGRGRLFPGLDDCALIVTTGNMHSDVKGHLTLIEAAIRVCSEFPHVRFVLIGDGARRQEFESKVNDLGLRRNFLFLGSRQDIPEILSCCDMAVAPSRAEGFSNAILEYLAAGLPTISSDVGGNKEIIEQEVSGILVHPNDPPQLAEAICMLLRNPDFAVQVGNTGKELVCNSFGFDQMVANVDALYTELLQKATGVTS